MQVNIRNQSKSKNNTLSIENLRICPVIIQFGATKSFTFV